MSSVTNFNVISSVGVNGQSTYFIITIVALVYKCMS